MAKGNVAQLLGEHRRADVRKKKRRASFSDYLKKMDIIFDELGYRPSKEQMAFHRCTARIRQMAGGVRAGKSFSTARDAVSRIVYASLFVKKQTIWIIGPDYYQPRAEFEYILDDLIRLGFRPSRKPSMPRGKSNQWSVEIGHVGVIETKTASDPRSLASFAPDGIIMAEAAQQPLEVYYKARERLAQKRGWLILSGCVTGDTYVFTHDGIRKIGDMVGDVTHPVSIELPGLVGDDMATLAWYNGAGETVKVRLSRGFEIEGTPDHKVIARLKDGSVTWVPLSDLTWDTLVAIPYGMGVFGDVRVDPDDAYEIGLYIAEGYMSKADRLTITNGDREIADFLKGRGYFPTKRKTKDGVITHWRKTDHDLADRWRALGFDFSLKAPQKVIPHGVLRFDRESMREVLRGMFDGDGSVTKRGAVYYTSSRELARQVQMLMLNFGIPAELNARSMKYKGGSRIGYSVNITDSREFAEIVGFRLDRKQKKAIEKEPPKFRRNQANAGSEFLGRPVLWSRVIEKEKGFARTYDLHVAGAHAYIGNGLILHNTFETSLGWYQDFWVRWQGPNAEGARSFSMPTWSNLAVFPGGENDPEIVALRNTVPEDLFMERYGAVPFKPHTLVFREFDASVHVSERVRYNPRLPVSIAVDPGYSPGRYAVLAIQVVGNDKTGQEDVWVVDELYESEMTGPEVVAKAKRRTWWKNVTDGVIDVAGRQHQAMRSQIEVWRQEGGVYLRSQPVGILDGIERHRTFLRDPGTGKPRLLHSPRCVNTIKEYYLYKRPEDSERNALRVLPIDRDNHAMKALAYWLYDRYGPVYKRRRKPGRIPTL